MRHIKLTLILIIIALLTTSCSFSHEGIITDDTSEDYNLYDYYIDDYGNEGIIAYVSDDRTCIIAISLDESTQYWGPTGEEIYKGGKTISDIHSLQFGVAMHQAMMSIGIEKFPAQNWCNQKNKSEEFPRAGSWRLPSRYDIMRIYGQSGQNVALLNKAIKAVNGTPLDRDGMYWTCVEDIEDYITFEDEVPDYDPANRAVVYTPSNTTYYNKDRWIKKNQYSVRAVKYVYYEY